MIMTSTGQKDQFTSSTPDPRFDVTAPSINPLVATLPIVVTKVKDMVEVSCTNEPSTGARTGAEGVLEQLSNEAKKDTLRFPQSARAHANFGVALAKAGRLEEAVVELETALSLEPTDYLAGVTLARVYVNQANYEKARSLYTHLLDHYPSSDSILLSLAYLSLRDNDFAAAEEFLESALRLSKKNAFPFFLLGVICLQRGNIHRAISALREAARLDLRSASLHHTLGVAYAMARDFERAARAFRMALALAPGTAPSLHALCDVLLQQREPACAFKLLKQRVESHPTDIAARDLFARACIDLGKYSRARSEFEAALRLAGDDMPPALLARFRANIGIAFLREGKDRAAEAQFRLAIEIAPRWSSAPYEALGYIAVQAEDLEKAKEILEHAKELFRDSQAVRRFLSVVFGLLGRYDLAIAELQEFWDRRTAESETYCFLGFLYEWTEDYATALRALSDGRKRFPKSPKIINNLAYTYLMVGEVERARSVLASLPRGIEPHPELVATQGLLRLWEGNHQTGISLYEKAARMASEAGDNSLAKRVRQKMHLEIARAFMHKGDAAAARIEIKRGLSLRLDTYSYRAKLEHLLDQLTA